MYMVLCRRKLNTIVVSEFELNVLLYYYFFIKYLHITFYRVRFSKSITHTLPLIMYSILFFYGVYIDLTTVFIINL